MPVLPPIQLAPRTLSKTQAHPKAKWQPGVREVLEYGEGARGRVAALDLESGSGRWRIRDGFAFPRRGARTMTESWLQNHELARPESNGPNLPLPTFSSRIPRIGFVGGISMIL